MELIVSHNNTDFDGLASMLAASKLYPSAVMVFEGKPTKQVREFLALHKDALPILDIKSIDLTEVTKVVVVDTRALSRVGSVAKVIGDPKVEVHIYDHHPGCTGDITGTKIEIAQVGAATTILVELIQANQMAVSAFEATVLALGIYEDTGSLLFESTTARDVRALAYLLETGANLKLVGQFMERPLSREQKSLLNTLLTSAKHYLIKTTRVLITTATIEEFVAGLALLTHKVTEIENLDVIFCVVKMDDRVHIVARSKGSNLAVNEVMQEFGGAGHAKAASATVKHGDVGEIVRRLLEVLAEKVLPESTAAEIMSTSVKSVPENTTMEEVGEILLRYGHTGIPVVQGAKLVGIISRRDIDKALSHKLGHSPVTGYMSREVITITSNTPVSQIQELMIFHDVGRLPVVENGVLVGIVSRSDVLRTLHGQAVPVSQQLLQQRSRVQNQQVLRLLEDLPLQFRDLFRLVQALGQEHGFRVYVVGGFVRDLLLGVTNFDIDLVVEGDGLAFATVLAESIEARVRFHPQFATANLTCQEGLSIDVVTARLEYYDAPAALPQVESSGLKQDLYRRDFTVNAMAISLNAQDFGSLQDYYGGYRDLQQGVIRILHNLSMVDDPTRILRALRFEQRLDFRLEKQTQGLMEKAIREKILGQVTRERIKNELVLILQEPKALQILQRLVNLDLWEQLAPGADIRYTLENLREVEAAVSFLRELGLWKHQSLWQVRLITLLTDCTVDETQQVLQNLKFERSTLNLANQFVEIKNALTGIHSQEGELKKGTVHRLLDRTRIEVVASLLTVRVLQSGIKEYLVSWAGAKVLVTGKDIAALGVPPGPKYAKILAALWEARLEGRVMNKEAELNLVRSLMEEEDNVHN